VNDYNDNTQTKSDNGGEKSAGTNSDHGPSQRDSSLTPTANQTEQAHGSSNTDDWTKARGSESRSSEVDRGPRPDRPDLNHDTAGRNGLKESTEDGKARADDGERVGEPKAKDGAGKPGTGERPHGGLNADQHAKRPDAHFPEARHDPNKMISENPNARANWERALEKVFR